MACCPLVGLGQLLATANGANDAVGNSDALANDASTHQRALQSSSRRQPNGCKLHGGKSTGPRTPEGL